MNRLLPCTAALALLGASVPAATPALASSSLQRCIGSDGTEVYTDRACGRLGASAIPLPAGLLGRIARDETAERRRDPLAGTVDASLPLDAGMSRAARRSPASGCAKSPAQLATDLRGALALGDVNRVAESYHWAGMSAKAGRHVMDRLQRLAARKAVDSRYYGSSGGIGGISDSAILLASAGDDAIGGTGLLQVVLGDDGARSVVDFDVHRYAGCYFVSF
ncbi:MAG TPA: hypothetical protein VM619_07720 [Luteimonas sp.]|nr:hypothetical protein [Luteimonas sp.]